MNKEEINEKFNKFASNIDLAETYISYLKWIIDNVSDSDDINYELYCDILECMSRFSLQEQQLLQFNKKLEVMKEKFENELKGKSIDVSYFEDIGKRIINKFKNK